MLDCPMLCMSVMPFTTKCKTAASFCTVLTHLVKCCNDPTLDCRPKSLKVGAPGTAPSHQPVVCNLTDLRRIKERSAWLHSTGWFAGAVAGAQASRLWGQKSVVRVCIAHKAASGVPADMHACHTEAHCRPHRNPTANRKDTPLQDN